MNIGGVPLPHRSSNGWFSLAKDGPTTAHVISTAVSLHVGHSLRRRFLSRRLSLLLRSSLKGVINKGGRQLVEWSNYGILGTYSSCICFFDGKPSREETRNEGSSSPKISSNSSFPRERWTNVLLAVNVVLYVAQVATQGKLMLWGAKINSLIDKGQFWRLVTSSFLHANIGHLLVNCYSLNSVGPTVENICGTKRFFTVYFASAVASTAMSYWLCQAPAVGASGAIFGLVGSIAVFSIRHRNLLGSGTRDLQQLAQVIALNMMIGLLSKGIDNWGHLGGLIGGVAVSWLIGPAWSYVSTTKDGRRVLIDRAPINLLTQRRRHRSS